MRHDGRSSDTLRQITIQRSEWTAAPGCVLAQAGGTILLCTASVSNDVPDWMADSGRGWVTVEYSMLPGSTAPRKRRDRGGKIDGRATEIQRLIGRSLRAVVDLDALGPRVITVDCDVLRADGGTRTLAITAACVALADALATIRDDLPDPQRSPLRQTVTAVSVGIVRGEPMLDLDYLEDRDAEVDMNVVMTGDGRFVEIQGTGEEATFDSDQLSAMLSLAKQGVAHLAALQQRLLGQNR